MAIAVVLLVMWGLALLLLAAFATESWGTPPEAWTDAIPHRPVAGTNGPQCAGTVSSPEPEAEGRAQGARILASKDACLASNERRSTSGFEHRIMGTPTGLPPRDLA